MKQFYKIVDNQAQVGNGKTIPEGFSEFTTTVDENGVVTYEPQELDDAIKAEEAKQAQLEAERVAKEEGEIYTLNDVDYKISFTKDDADGMMQVKTAFEMGLTATNIHFYNGTVVPVDVDTFTPLAIWFVEKRNSFFV